MSSPLLEDINLAGANGILVNVTAGMDLAIGEFQEVGNTVKEFASDDATVVVGTVIDPDMGDKIRVTVVATGLGKNAAAGRLADAGRQAYVGAGLGAGLPARWTSRRCKESERLVTASRKAACRKNCWIFRHFCDARRID